MKTRTPISIYILVTLGLTIMAFEMFAHDSGYFSSPFFWGLLLIAIILLLIMNSIGDLIEIKISPNYQPKKRQNI